MLSFKKLLLSLPNISTKGSIMLLNKRIPISYIFNKVKLDILYVSMVSLSVLFITEKYMEVLPTIPLAIPAFIGTAISVLLSFKLSQSYERWWEARKIWGSIVNDSRSLILQLKTLVVKGNDSAIRKIAYRQIGWCYSLGQTLRVLAPLENMEKYILCFASPPFVEIEILCIGRNCWSSYNRSNCLETSEYSAAYPGRCFNIHVIIGGNVSGAFKWNRLTSVRYRDSRSCTNIRWWSLPNYCLDRCSAWTLWNMHVTPNFNLLWAVVQREDVYADYLEQCVGIVGSETASAPNLS